MKNAVGPVTTSRDRRDRSYEYKRAKRRRAQAQGTYRCLWCREVFTSAHHNARWCSHRCRTAADRAPKIWALIVWAGQLHAEWTFHASHAAARAAAPVGQPWTVVDVAVPVTPCPSPAEYLYSRYVEGKDPYAPSQGRKGAPWRV